jgi:uncharacterized membrane protein
MSGPSDRLRDHLAPDERLTAAYSVRLSGTSVWTPPTLGVTDRRLLWVGDGGRAASIDLDYVTGVRSRRRTRPRFRGRDHRLQMGGSGLLAALCLVGVVVLSSNLLVPLLSLVTVGGLAATEYLWRAFDEIQVEAIAGTALVAAASYLGIVVAASSVVAPLLVLLAIGGVALVEYARRRASDFGGIEMEYRHHREVSISTADGRTVHVRCDPSEQIDRELSRLAFVDRADPASAARIRS